jgi:hypothetical protein
VKTIRQIGIADHLWDALGRMADEMGSDRDALVNQALHVFARLNGFALPGAPGGPRPAVAPPVPDDPERRAVAERVLEKAAALEREMHDPTPAGEIEPPPIPTDGPRVLVLVGDEGELGKVAKDRFVIGRGKHCDLVIDSTKVSREHAAIVREGPDYFIEDLGSSNGTWHDRARVQRRRIEHGDEYFICSERIRCVLR